ncbi:MAG: amidohydrolase family protein [Clostridia bacterium]|nr:amidohydrolase family protein [Clostridia bacterium]
MVIDFHTHIFPEKIAAATVSALAKSACTEPYTDGTEAGLLSALEEAGADIAVNLPVLTRAKQFDSITAFAEGINAKSYTGARIISFAGIHPEDECAEEHLERIKDAGFLGIKIHPDYQGHFIDSEEYIRILSVAKSLGLITVTHAGLDGAFVGEPIKCTPRRVYKLLERLGGYDRLVLAHMGGRALADEFIEVLGGSEVYIDTGYVLPELKREGFEKILLCHGEDRILFATDSPWQSIRAELERIKSYSLGEATEEKILAGNAKKLLGLDL